MNRGRGKSTQSLLSHSHCCHAQRAELCWPSSEGTNCSFVPPSEHSQAGQVLPAPVNNVFRTGSVVPCRSHPLSLSDATAEPQLEANQSSLWLCQSHTGDLWKELHIRAHPSLDLPATQSPLDRTSLCHFLGKAKFLSLPETTNL